MIRVLRGVVARQRALTGRIAKGLIAITAPAVDFLTDFYEGAMIQGLAVPNPGCYFGQISTLSLLCSTFSADCLVQG